MPLQFFLSDFFIWAFVLLAVVGLCRSRQSAHFSRACQHITAHRLGMIAATVLAAYFTIGLLDSVHVASSTSRSGAPTLLDKMLVDARSSDETTYSSPFAIRSFVPIVVLGDNGQKQQVYPRLNHGGHHLQSVQNRPADLLLKSLQCLCWVSGIVLLIGGLSFFVWAFLKKESLAGVWRVFWRGETRGAWREVVITAVVLIAIFSVLVQLSQYYHVLGTDKVGHDVFYATIKSIRTGLLIGILTTVFMLPFAVIFGLAAGFFGGWVDDVIQYIYTTVSSIPGVLLISATLLVTQVYLSAHPQWFTTLAQRADVRLVTLCMVLGLTGWAGLCRLIRAEALKLRELEFVVAARTLGAGRWTILYRHLLPNIMHILIIALVLDFSMLVLAEAVLSYVGVGVDPTTFSWGNMINSSRLELARAPVVWWPLNSALVFMFLLVLSANIFADSVRDALDPRLNNRGGSH